MRIEPWSNKKELKALCDESPLGIAILRYLNERWEPMDTLNHLLELVKHDTVPNIRNREVLEGLVNVKYERKKRTRKRRKASER